MRGAFHGGTEPGPEGAPHGNHDQPAEREKGGKTSTCHHLAGTLAKAGQRVLLRHNDPRASLSQGFCGPDATRRIGAAESVAALYDADLAPIPEALSESLQAAPAGERGVRQRASVGSTEATSGQPTSVSSDRSRFISRNDVTLRGARGDCAQGRSGRSRAWPRFERNRPSAQPDKYRCREAPGGRSKVAYGPISRPSPFPRPLRDALDRVSMHRTSRIDGLMPDRWVLPDPWHGQRA
jgi:hypothetical protein